MQNKENKINNSAKYLVHDIEDFTLKNLEEYCEKNQDNINRIILNAAGILTGRHDYEFNLILNQLIDDKLADDMEEINKFRLMWIEKVMI